MKRRVGKSSERRSGWWSEIPLGLWSVIVLYSLMMVGWSTFQYAFFLYDGLDLGIFDQVIWNTAHGRPYQYSFAPYSYLVDHRPWLLLLLVPLYWVAAHPLTLLIVQSVIIASSALPAYLLARQVLASLFPSAAATRRAAAVAASLFLLHPAVLSMNLYEFHLLPLVLPLSLWFWWSLQQRPRRLGLAIDLVAALLLLREDVSLMVAGLGLLLLSQRDRQLRWFGAIVVTVALIWFVAMQAVGVAASPVENNTFAIFYERIGGSPAEIVENLFTEPGLVLSVLLDYDHALLLWYLVASFALLPVLRPRFLLPLLGPLAVYLLMDRYISGPVFQSHLAAPLLPWLYIGALEGFVVASRWCMAASHRIGLSTVDARRLVGLLVVAVALGHTSILGPAQTVKQQWQAAAETPRQQFAAAVAAVGPTDAVLTTNRFWPHLSQREALYTTLHLYWGRHYHSGAPYSLPDPVDWVILEHAAVVGYGVHVPLAERTGAADRLQELIDRNGLVPVLSQEDFFVLGKQPSTTAVRLVQKSEQPLSNPANLELNHDLRLLDWEFVPPGPDRESGTLRLRLEKMAGQPVLRDDQHLRLRWFDATGRVSKERFFALGFGFDPTHRWEAGSGQARLIELPVTQPAEAVLLEAAFGPVTGQFTETLVAGSAQIALDPAWTTALPLPGVTPGDSPTR